MAATTKTANNKTDENQDQTVTSATQNDQPDSKTNVSSAGFQQVEQTQDNGAPGSIDILLDLTVPITVTIGHTNIPVRRLLQMGPGSVLKLDNNVDEPVELFLKDNKFATGEIVVVDDHFAVKIKQIFGVNAAATKKP